MLPIKRVPGGVGQISSTHGPEIHMKCVGCDGE